MDELSKFKAIINSPEDLDEMIRRFMFNAKAMSEKIQRLKKEIESLKVERDINGMAAANGTRKLQELKPLTDYKSDWWWDKKPEGTKPGYTKSIYAIANFIKKTVS